MSRPPRHAKPSYGSLRIFFGVAFSCVIGYTLFLGRVEPDWPAKAKDALDERDYPEAIKAAGKAIEVDPNDYESMFVRARAAKTLRMPKLSLDDIEAAIIESPSSTRLIAFKASLLQDLSDHEGAIALLDEAYERLDHDPSLLIQATSSRLRYFKMLSGGLGSILGRFHPDRIEVPTLVTSHFASTDPHGVTRQAIVDVLPGSGLQEDVGESLDRAWSLLRESDELLGDIRERNIAVPAAFLNRAEVDLHLGRLLSAKENLQTLVARSLDPSTRRRAYELLTETNGKSRAYAAQAAAAAQIVALAGGETEARLSQLADVFEAEYFAAAADPSLRDDTLARFDAHLAKHPNEDMRTLAYRGIATLEWEGDPAASIRILKDVFDALRYQRSLDPSIAEPSRARRFVLGLLEAYLAANQPQRGLDVANVLVGISTDDPEILVRRARIRAALGQSEAAANDLLAAMRSSKRDPELFQAWLDSASIVEDTGGRTPVMLAHLAAERLRATKKALREELDNQRTYDDVQRFRQNGTRISQTMAQIGEISGKMATDPIIAWHLAQEFGREGATVESRNFLFRASTREPEVGAFRFRLAQYRLDLGHYATAAEDFERILIRDPGDSEAARYAMQSWRLAGRIRDARRVAEQVSIADPTDGGLKVCAEALLDIDDGVGALRLLAPHSDTNDPELMLLFARAALAAGRYPAARDWYGRVDAIHADQAEVVAGIVMARGLAGERGAFLTAIERFGSLPRLLPAPQIQRMLDRIDAAGQPLLSAMLASRIADRFPADIELRFRERAAIVSFRAGRPALLRALRDERQIGERLSNATVAAAFGLTLRELGPHAAANYLQASREFTAQRDWAVLPTAAAFALTPLQIELTTFLGRYERTLGETGVPGGEAVLWWLTRLRTENKPVPAPNVAVEARSELDSIRENTTRAVADDGRLDETYLRFLLFAFAGPGFENDALVLARQVAGLSDRFATAARYVAARTAITDGPEAALPDLLPVQRANPDDRSLYLLTGQLLVLSQAAESTLLLNYSRAGLTLYPKDPEVLRLAAMAALRAGSPQSARVVLEQVLATKPGDIGTLRVMAQVARSPGQESAGADVARAVARHGLRDPVLRGFVLERYALGTAPESEAIEVLNAIVAADPAFYPAAIQLARRLEASERDDELSALARSVARVIPDDRGADDDADLFLELAQMLRRRSQDDAASLLVDAALFAQPAHIPLRLMRIELLRSSSARGAAIGDLRLLCALSPASPQILFEYAVLLLEERTDLADVVVRVLPRIQELTNGDERYLLLKAKDLFRLDRLADARAALRQAVEKAPRELDAWYLLGLCAYLDGDPDEARRALEEVTPRHPFFRRAQYIKKML